jgi:prolipoprotein diacylglyceryl transferase
MTKFAKHLGMLNYIHWNVHPEVLPDILPVRWYGLLFMSGFVFGYYILEKIFKAENKDIKWLDNLALYVGAGTILGARLGHCLFYEPEYYLSHPIEMFKIWEGGLASHGAVIGILLSHWLFAKKHLGTGFFWVTDRVVIVVALAATCIRLGNLMNSEIVGSPTEVPWAFIFERLGDNIPRHPTQIYEALAYLIIFVILYRAYWKADAGKFSGRLFGYFLTLVFGFRFFIEFIKDVQVDFEKGMALNMGQWLSLPLVIVGLWLIYSSKTRKDN